MANVDENPAFKLFIKDLTNCERLNETWQIYFCDMKRKPRNLGLFQLQATIVKITGFSNEILIVEDPTGKAKVTRSSKVPGEFSWLKQGAVCSIVGTLIKSGKLPQVDATKLARVTNEIQREMWSLEVKELRNLLANKVAPVIDPS